MKLKKRTLIILFVLVVAFSFLVLAACDPKPEEEPTPAGPEAGIYYYEEDGVEHLITLSEGNSFTFAVLGDKLAGKYTLTGAALVFDFLGTEKADLPATLSDNMLSFTYSGAELHFRRKVNFTVTFDSAGGSAVASKSVENGRALSDRPADPTRPGYTFIGWYNDSTHNDPFVFGTQIITADKTLYAFWGESVLGKAEYAVDFNLNYENASTIAPMTTIGGKLYNVITPEWTGHTFGGWWISMYDDAEKLSYRYTENTVFAENTTLHALWIDNAVTGLSAPEVDLAGNTVSWNGATGVTYRFQVEGPIGFTAIDRTSDGTSETIDFDRQPAGDYTITVTATRSAESVSTVRYFKNKALAAVSVFSVVEPSALVFLGVDNAQRYFITIDCGNNAHNHERFPLGSSTNYNFVNCPMQEGGIVFRVTAEADGYASSTSKAFYHDRLLAAINENTFIFDNETETLTWGAVVDADSYIVKILCGDENHDHSHFAGNIGNVTSLCLQTCAPREGGIVVEILPVTKGYNSPEIATYVFEKTTLAAPGNLRVEDELLVWDGDPEGTYQVRVGTAQPVTVNTNSFSLSDLVAMAAAGTDYSVTVRARSDNNNSVWSDVLNARYYAMYGTISYSRGLISWRPVIGATSYQIRYNGDISTLRNIPAGQVSCEADFPFSGRNMIEVRFMDGTTGGGAWVTLEVIAYRITFDSRGGSSVPAINKAYGDKMPTLSVPNRPGYEFAGWYNAIGGAEGNGAKYEDEFFTENGDIVLYAYWQSQSRTITYNYYGGIAPENSQGSARVIFDMHYTLEIPIPENGTLVFGGWYQEPGGQGTRYTNELGESEAVWSIVAENTTVYAYWIEGLAYRASSNNAYAVFKGPDINEVKNLIIPATYNDLPVAYIDSGAFAGCSSLETVEIPDTIVQVGATGSSPFSDCNNLREINVYHVEGNNIIAYSSVDGVLIWDDETTGEKFIMFVPLAKTDSLVIPYGVTEIPIRAFANARISSVTIPASVRAIRQRAFTGCSNLSEVVFLPGGDELIIESNVFTNCGSLTSITLPKRMGRLPFGNESLGITYGIDIFNGSIYLENVFVEEGNAHYSSVDGVLCTALGDTIVYFPSGKAGKYVVPTNVTAIGEHAFTNHRSLSEVVFHAGITTIGKEAFFGCYALRTVTFEGGLAPATLTIGESAFAFSHVTSSAITSVVFEDNSNVVEIGPSAFINNGSLTSITIPNTVRVIGEDAFANCGLTSVELQSLGGELPEDSGLTIENYAFRNCVGLTSFTLSDVVTELNMNVFDGCVNLQGVYVAEGNKSYADEEGVLYDIDKTIILFYSLGRDGNVELPDTLVAIGAGVFAGNLKINEINIPATVNEIQEDAFNGCLYLRSIVFRASIDPDAHLTIGDRAFSYCATLTTLDLPAYVVAIGEEAFFRAAVLKTINFSDGLIEIGDSAFAETALEIVALPDSLTTLGASAFAGCASLTSIILSTSLDAIGASAFANCEKLTTVTIPDGVTAIGANAFENCYELSEITIPNTVESIGNSAFLNCASLATVTFAGGGTAPLALGSLTTGSSSNGMFVGCESLSAVVLPERLVSIGRYVFYGCAQLSSITFEKDSDGNPLSNLEKIGHNAFENCGLTEFFIANTVSEIAQYAFSGASKLVSVVFEEDGEGAAESLQLGTIASATSSTSSVFANTALTSISLPKRTGKLLESGATATKGRIYSIFGGVTTLNYIEIHAENPYYKSYNGALYTKDGTALVIFPSGRTEITTEQPLLEGIVEIKDYAFNYSQLTNFTIPGTVAAVKDFVFAQSALESVTITKNVLTMGVNVFQNCSALSKVEFEEGGRLTALENLAFQNTALETLDLTNTMITRIGGGNTVFRGSSITNITLPETLEEIGASAFTGINIESITIPASVTKIGAGAFYNCNQLSTLEFAEYDGNGTAPSLEIGDAGNGISSGAFADSALETVRIPGRVTLIGVFAFADTPTLTSVTFEDAENGSLKNIRRNAFQNTGLTEFVVPATVTDLGEEYVHNSNKAHSTTYVQTMRNYGVFLNCVNLRSITISAAMTKFWSQNIVGCTALTEIKVADGSANFSVYDGVLYNSDGTRLICYPTGKTGEVYDVRDETTHIEYRAFAEATNLRTVNIPNTVVYLGYGVFNKSPVERVVFAPGGTADVAFDATAPGGSTSSNYNSTMFGWSALKSIVLPARLTKLPNFFFEGCSELTSVEFEQVASPEDSKLTTLGNAVFRYCSALESFDMPDSVTTVEGTTGLFLDCSSLSNVKLSANLPSLAQNMFLNCVSLETLEIPASVKTIALYALKNSGIVRLVIPDTAAFSGSGMNQFLDCSKLEYIEIQGDSLKSLGSTFFSGCTSLREVVLPASVKTLGKEAFLNCESLESIDLSNITTIGNNTFSGCVSLESIDLSNVGSIGDYAFLDCVSLTSVVISGSVESLGANVFRGCINLESLTVSGDNSFYKIGEKGELLNYDGTMIVLVPVTTTGEYEIPEGMTVGAYAFANSGVTKVIVPSTMTEITEGMFENCLNLIEVVLHDDITEIGRRAFANSGLTRVYIGRKVTLIGVEAFMGCEALEEIEFAENGSTSLSLHTSSFEGCVSLTSIELPRRVRVKERYTTDRNGNVVVNIDAPAIGVRSFFGCINLETVTFAETGAEWMTAAMPIGAYAFQNCESLVSITLPDYNRTANTSYPAIGAYAFAGCTSLVSFVREGRKPSSAYNIGNSAFLGCTALKTVNIPNNPSFGTFVFSETGLENISLSFTGAWGSAASMFENCALLENVTITHTGLIATSIYSRMFANCTALESVTIINERGVSSFYAEAFLNCTSLTTLTIPGGLREIAASAFENCTSLMSLTIPASVATVGANAFAGWTAAQTITIQIEEKKLPANWNSDWRVGCLANIVWPQPEQEDIPETT